MNIICPNCRQVFEGSEDYVGTEVECPSCYKTFVVAAEPTPATEQNHTPQHAISAPATARSVQQQSPKGRHVAAVKHSKISTQIKHRFAAAAKKKTMDGQPVKSRVSISYNSGLFGGRATRSKYWIVTGICFAISIAACAVLFVMCWSEMSNIHPREFEKAQKNIETIRMITNLIVLGCCIPVIPITVRRWHDLGRSGWMIVRIALCSVLAEEFGRHFFITFQSVLMPILSFLIAAGIQICAFVDLGFRDGQPFENKYGPDPKGRDKSTNNN